VLVFKQAVQATGDTAQSWQPLEDRVIHVTAALGDAELAAIKAGTGFQGARRFLADFGTEAGLTFTALGLLGSAAAVAGTAFASWSVTRIVMEMTGLDSVVESAWQHLLNFDDVVKETSGATGDVLAKASKIAGVEITNLSQAVQIVNQDFKDWKVAEKKDDVDAAKEATKALAAEVRAAAKADAEWRKESDDFWEARKRVTAQLEADRLELLSWVTAVEAATAPMYKAKFVDLGTALQEVGIKTKPSVHDLDAFTAAQDSAARATANAFEQSFKDAQAQDALNASMKAAVPAVQANDQALQHLTISAGNYLSVADQIVRNFQSDFWGSNGPGRGIFFGGAGPTANPISMIPGPVMGGAGSSGGGGGGLNITNNITQPLGTPQAISRAVGDAVMASVRNRGDRVPAGA
jgi:hypothetical protein